MNRMTKRTALTMAVFVLAGTAPIVAATGKPVLRSLEGWIEVVWGDPAPGSSELGRRVIQIRSADGSAVEVEVGEALAFSVQRWMGKRVAASIEHVDSSNALPVLRTVRLLEGSRRGGVGGSQPWVSIPCKFSNIATEPEDLDFFLGMYANVPGGLDHYWRELSYGAIDIVGSTAIDWVTLPNPQTFYIPTPGSGSNANLSALFDDCTAAADALVDFSNGGSPFVGINLMFNGLLDCCAWGGGRFATLDGISKVWRTTWEPPWGFANEGVMGHEMGHGFGLPHSNNFDGDSSPYDSPWDVMSSATGYAVNDPVYGALGKHTLVYHKDVLGWITPSQLFEVPDNSSNTIVIDAQAVASTSNYRMARVSITGSSRYYTVESRDLIGSYDGALPGRAVIITEVLPGRSEPAWVVDSDVPPANYGDNEGSMWRVGETFVDEEASIAITVLSATADGFEVEILSGVVASIFADGFETGDTSLWQ